LLEEALNERINDALNCFKDDPVYGVALQRLVQYRLAWIDLPAVSSTVSLEGLADPWLALFFSDRTPFHSYTVQKQQEKAPASEIDTFWQAVIQHAPLHERLIQFSTSWQDNVCHGAQACKAFFSAYPRVTRLYRDAPFFVRELLQMSLENVNWHVIVSRLLRVELPSCSCVSSLKTADAGVQVALFEELLTQIAADFRQLSPLLPEPQRGMALFLRNFCEQAPAAATTAE
jgi:hypothetical protein